MKTCNRIAAVALAATLITGCADTNEPEPEQAQEQVEESPDEPEPDAVDEPAEEAEVDEANEASENELPIEAQTIETGGFTLAIENLGYLNRDDLGAEADDVLEADTQTVLALNMTVENTTDDTLAFYPDQSTLIVGNQQVEAHFFLSEQVGGDFIGNVVKDGVVMYETSLSKDEVEALGEVRYVVDGPHDEDFERVGDDVDVTLSW